MFFFPQTFELKVLTCFILVYLLSLEFLYCFSKYCPALENLKKGFARMVDTKIANFEELNSLFFYEVESRKC